MGGGGRGINSDGGENFKIKSLPPKKKRKEKDSDWHLISGVQHYMAAQASSQSTDEKELGPYDSNCGQTNT